MPSETFDGQLAMQAPQEDLEASLESLPQSAVHRATVRGKKRVADLVATETGAACACAAHAAIRAAHAAHPAHAHTSALHRRGA